jgi:hypothetical protein
MIRTKINCNHAIAKKGFSFAFIDPVYHPV